MCCFARRLVRGGGVVVGLDRVLVGLGGVVVGFLVIALDVVLGSQGSTPLPYQGTFSQPVTDTTKYRYIAAVKTTNEYFYIGELDEHRI